MFPLKKHLPEDLRPYSLLKCLSVLVVFVSLHYFLHQYFVSNILQSAEEIYHSSTILISTLLKPQLATSVIILLLPFVFWAKESQWSQYSSQLIRLVTVFLAFVLGWQYIVYDPNFFFNQFHFFDRVILLTSMGLIYVHPGFIALFVVQFFLVRTQFLYPLGIYIHIDVQLPLVLLILTLSYLYLNLIFRIRITYFWLFFISLTAAHYFSSGIEKLIISPYGVNWITDYKLHFPAAGAQTLGWMGNFPSVFPWAVLCVTKSFGPILNGGVFILELSTIAILLTPIVTIIIFAGLLLFQFGVFLLIGNIFWKWMLILLMISILIYLYKNHFTDLYRPGNQVMAVLLVIIFAVSGWGGVPKLGWWETRYFYSFEWSVQTDSGQQYALDRSSFGGYELLLNFDFNRLLFLVNKKILPDATKQLPVAQSINHQLNSVQNYNRLLEKYGQNFYDEKQTRRFKRLIQQYSRNQLKSNYSRPSWFRFIKPPKHLYIYSGRNRTYHISNIPGEIQNIHLVFKEFYYNGKKAIVLNQEPVLQISP